MESEVKDFKSDLENISAAKLNLEQVKTVCNINSKNKREREEEREKRQRREENEERERGHNEEI